MANEINTGKKTNGQFTIEYQRSGRGGVIPVIDGTPQPSLMFGYVTESDKNACMQLIEDALRATGGDIGEVQRYIMNAVQVAAKDIKPDEAVDVDGTEVLISYVDRKAYEGTVEIANLDDMTCELPDEAVKAMLIDRVRLVLEAREAELQFYEDYDFDAEDED